MIISWITVHCSMQPNTAACSIFARLSPPGQRRLALAREAAKRPITTLEINSEYSRVYRLKKLHICPSWLSEKEEALVRTQAV